MSVVARFHDAHSASISSFPLPMRRPKLNRLSACLPARRAQAGNAQAGARERRLDEEIVVDAYTSDERAIGWHCHLDGKLRFPFKAKCIAAREIAPLKIGEEVEVLGMAPEDNCMREMFVLVRYTGRRLGVPLAQLDPVKPGKATREATED